MTLLRRGRVRLVIGVGLSLFVLGVASWFLVRFPARGEPASAPPQGPEPEFAVTEVIHDDGVTILVTPAGERPWPEGTTVVMDLTTPAGPWTVASPLVGWDEAALDLAHVRAGVAPYTLTIAYPGGRVRVDGRLARVPGPATRTLDLAVGARTTRVAGQPGSRRPALVVHPLDVHANVADDPVRVQVDTPGGDRWATEIRAAELLAWTYLPVSEEPGLTRVAAMSGLARGERSEVDQLPGPGASATVGVPRTSGPVSGRDPWRLAVDDLADFGAHPTVDGDIVMVQGSGPGGDLFLARPSVGTAAELVVPVPDTLGAHVLQVSVGSFASEPLIFEATRAFVGTIGLQMVATPDDGRPVLRSEPLFDGMGALLDDGFPVGITVRDARGRSLASYDVGLHDGRVMWPLPALPAAARGLEVSVGGVRERMALDRLGGGTR